MKTFYIKDNVCTPYKLMLNRMSNYLKANKMFPADKACAADMVIIGTCGAFKSLEDEAVGFIESAKKDMKKGAELVVYGCLLGINVNKVKSYSPNRTIASSDWAGIEALVENPVILLKSIPQATGFRGKEDYRLYDPGKQFILLQTGCSSNCPFCPHKMGIGGLKSIPPEYILDQVRNLEEGVHTICLAGNDTGSYGTDIGTTYPELLKQILAISDRQIHLSQVNADWLYVYRDEMWPLLMNENVREFQVLIQSTSDRLIGLMDRRPIISELKPYFKKLREACKDLLLRTDLIIGYPTATEEEDWASAKFVVGIFDEVAIHAFERFEHARIEKLGLSFYSPEVVNARTEKIVAYLQQFPNVLVHRGGQVIKTLEAIEKPKDDLRKKFNCARVPTLPLRMRREEKNGYCP